MLDDVADDVNDILSECDSEFYKYQDNLNQLNYQFILKNKTQFICEK